MEPVPNGFKIYHKKENKMNHKKTAKDIIDYAGGKENIKAVEHCATRLRIEVLEEDKIQKEEIEELEGVKGAMFHSGQYQIILGTGTVNKVYNEVIKILTTVLRANLFLKTEYQQLQTIMQQFPLNNSSLTVESLATIKELSILEKIIVSSTELDLTDKNICLTGTFKKFEIIELIKTLRSKKIYPLGNVSPQVSYLIVGASKSSCWPFYSYGRKVEDILTLQKDHHHIKIITEEQLIEFFNKNN